MQYTVAKHPPNLHVFNTWKKTYAVTGRQCTQIAPEVSIEHISLRCEAAALLCYCRTYLSLLFLINNAIVSSLKQADWSLVPPNMQTSNTALPQYCNEMPALIKKNI